MNRRLLLCIALFAATLTLGADDTPMGTHRVHLAFGPTDDAATVAKAVAATYGARLEAGVASDATVPMTVDPAVIELMARDPRVRQLTTIAPEPEQPARATLVRTPRAEDTTGWTTGTYAYDAAGNITGMGSDDFTYDLHGRIKTGTAAGQSQEYAYDMYGNLISIKTGTTTIASPANVANNRLTSINGTAVTYNAAGQVTQVGTSAYYAYDGLGMMKSSGAGSTPSTIYLYTPSDERIASVGVSGTTESASTWTFRDAAGKVLRRYDRQKISGQWTWLWREDYIYNGSQMLASEHYDAPRTRHYFPDHLGTPRLITDGGGMEIGRATYLPFGAPAQESGILDSKRFTGHERDASGLDYMHARYYQWGWGRFLSVDPTWSSADLGKPQSWNRYSYVLNNPVNLTDPDGKCPYCIDGKELSLATYATAAEFFVDYVLLDGSGMEGSSADLPKDPAERAKYIEQRLQETAYQRPSGATTPEQRAAVQDKACEVCGKDDGGKRVAGHKKALVQEHYETGTIDKQKMRSVEAVRPECPTCSAREGAAMSRYSRSMKKAVREALDKALDKLLKWAI